MTYPTIFLLRHGQTEWNIAARLQGTLDSALTEKGRLQALRQGALLDSCLSQYPDMSVLSSPQGRALKTAKIASEGNNLSINQDIRLREISAGSWDGAYLDDIERNHGHLFEQARNAFELMFFAPDGEGKISVLARSRAVLADQKKPVILVTHGATLCVLRGLLRGMQFEEMLNLDHEQGCIYQIKDGVETILR